ncbi:sialidase family protein [Chitinophaga eiseniae]|uniref:Exo-alpha-sialidase n=1 Tax=Chitinophaga eiseniae TaxID=634771 RepID=A0A847SQY5_9BACT|nr:sialidase family protein [Chitinophaga eiseniae]NLR80348.1 exo-alpha-sialidase [Chitinophaga eiseniae]
MKKVAAGLMLGLMFSCHRGQVQPEHTLVLSHAGKAASCPFITQDGSGHPVVSWVEKDDSTENGLMLYAVSNDNGYTFSSPVAVTATAGVFPHDENLPKILFKPDGTVIALFGVEANDPRNKYAGKVMYTQSFDGGKHWQPAVPLVTDTAGYDQRYFDMALLPGGEAAAIWLDNRKQTNAEGSTLYFAVTHGHSGFGQAKPIAATVCQCCRTKLYVAGNGDVHVAYRDIINDSIRDMVHQVSTDGGQSFSAPVRISADNWVVNGCPHTGPTLTANSQGLHFAWFTMGGGQGAFYCRSLDNGNTYTQKESLSKAPMAKHPQMTTVNDDILVVWDEPVKWKNDFNSRVGFQYKAADGKTMQAGMLTTDSSYANFPVVGAVKDHKALVAYKRREAQGSQVVVTRLNID